MSHEMKPHHLSFDDFDETVYPRPETTDFDRVVDTALSRRGLLGGALAFGGFAALAGTVALPRAAQAATDRFAFATVPISTADAVTVPPGYTAEILVRWGDPLWSDVPDFDPATRGTSASQARAFGDNTDGMEVFPFQDRLLLAINNEYTNRSIIWGNLGEDQAPGEDDIAKGMMAHGVSIVELAPTANGGWQLVKDSPNTRRITPQTPMEITGPARGHDLLKTAADPTGTTSLGTWNNCGSGKTPWGTYLTCEENFNGYFSSSEATEDQKNVTIDPALQRYGISAKDWGYGWARIDDRFDIATNPNEPNRAGYVVEIDPRDPASTPKKRTALGRFKHENAECVVNSDGRLVIYLGDDERGEFLYRYVSDGVYAAGVDTDDLMENGALYAAKFHDTGAGEWLALTPETTGMSAAEICIHTRQAASAVGATTMDRPEWVTANPTKAEVYCALTNNKNRGVKPNAGGDLTPVGGPNPREANKYGQIVRWTPNGGDHTAGGFAWDLYVMAGNPDVHQDARAGSGNVHSGNMFNSPDGLAFDSAGLLWIQTDGKYSNEGDFAGQGNNQMLAGDRKSVV